MKYLNLFSISKIIKKNKKTKIKDKTAPLDCNNKIIETKNVLKINRKFFFFIFEMLERYKEFTKINSINAILDKPLDLGNCSVL